MMQSKKKILFFTGAGISAESGLATFRNSPDGLWENYKIEEVCSFDGWENDPALVLEFYNKRRIQCLEAKPNRAHQLIAELEQFFDVTIVTQNVDDLHERAGSSTVFHLHGELLKVRSTADKTLIYPCDSVINIGDKCELGSQLRPHIVWFGEELDDDIVLEAKKSAILTDICVVIGTSMQVYPANTIPFFISPSCKFIFINPDDVYLDLEEGRSVHYLKETAVNGMEQLVASLKRMM